MRINEITEIGGMGRPDFDYEPVVLETYFAIKAGKKSRVHARPLKGQQSFPSDLDAECCRQMRKDYPIGTAFLVWGKVTNRQGKGEFVYTYHGWPFEVVGK